MSTRKLSLLLLCGTITILLLIAMVQPSQGQVASFEPAAPEASMIFTATKDTYINQGAATTGYGTSNVAYLGHGAAASSFRYILVYFDLSTLPAGALVTGATLLLYPEINLSISQSLALTPTLVAAPTPQPLTVYADAITFSWSENVPWQFAPPHAYQSDPTAMANPYMALTVDVTHIMQNWQLGL